MQLGELFQAVGAAVDRVWPGQIAGRPGDEGSAVAKVVGDGAGKVATGVNLVGVTAAADDGATAGAAADFTAQIAGLGKTGGGVAADDQRVDVEFGHKERIHWIGLE